MFNEFPSRFEQYWLNGMRRKLGLATTEDGDRGLIRSLLDWMEQSQADYTNTFLDLSEGAPLAGQQYGDPSFQTWPSKWRERLAHEGRPEAVAQVQMRSVNPTVIPRNHRVEEALSAAEEHGDLSVTERLLSALASPFAACEGVAYYQEPQDDRCYQTFCGA